MKVALVYDRLNKIGGAERVLLALHKMFPDAPLYTSVYNSKKASWASVFKIKTSFLQNFPWSTHHEMYAFLMPLAFESFNFDEYDLVISVTSEAAKGILTKPKTKHICYCLTPTRYLWSGYEEYFRNFLLRLISKPIVFCLKIWDKIAAQRPDAYIAISKEVQKRIKKYYGRDSAVIYPPALTFDYPQNLKSQDKDYFLIVSRLVSYKKIDLAIRAFNELKLPLKIIGKGIEENRLKAMAGPTIEFLDYLTDKELVEYYSGCRALIFPGLEDFGLTILEAQGFGKPVIAFKAGGALETVVEGKTGKFFNKQEVKSLVNAIREFGNLTINPKDCIAQAKKFNYEQFKESFTKRIGDLLR